MNWSLISAAVIVAFGLRNVACSIETLACALVGSAPQEKTGPRLVVDNTREI